MGSSDVSKHAPDRQFTANKVDDFRVTSGAFVVWNKGRLADHYTIIKTLGTGSFGTINLAYHHLTQEDRAIKTISKNRITRVKIEREKF
jgi:serine/threonine protein kinase